MALPRTQEVGLQKVYGGAVLEGNGWGTLEAFIAWSEENGYVPGLRLYKIDRDKTHGPDNSYWYDKYKDKNDAESPFCKNCTADCPGGGGTGCKAYREWWRKNWNENICIKKPDVGTTSGGREYFRYEHPDLVREGIVFEPDKHIR